jgi:hypothetical protein
MNEQSAATQTGYNSFALISLVGAALSVVTVAALPFLLGIFIGLVSFILSIISLVQIARRKQKGKFYAIVALIISFVVGVFPLFEWGFLLALALLGQFHS